MPLIPWNCLHSQQHRAMYCGMNLYKMSKKTTRAKGMHSTADILKLYRQAYRAASLFQTDKVRSKMRANVREMFEIYRDCDQQKVEELVVRAREINVQYNPSRGPCPTSRTHTSIL